MGFEQCTAQEKTPQGAKYFFGQVKYDINSGKDDEMKEKCKLEVKITNISSGNCKIGLVQYTDNTRKTILKNEGETESASANSSSKTIKFNKFYIIN